MIGIEIAPLALSIAFNWAVALSHESMLNVRHILRTEQLLA